ncbi:DUF1360 domain-containing protein [Streptomyces toxytricini]|uniref:DUF1360 domain-containing protein n=1 Tax=Streptomyces toxytricini TaxID=67369 RepID=A0ABW8EFN7_STRT5
MTESTTTARDDAEHHHLAALAAFGLYAAAWARAAERHGSPDAAPGRASGVLLTGAATFRLSRLITKAKITRPLRAPFTDVDGPGAPAELNETPKAGRRVAGSLLSCPFCLGVWVATTLTGARALWPHATGAVERTLAAVAAADAMQLAYARLVRAAEGEPQ